MSTQCRAEYLSGDDEGLLGRRCQREEGHETPHRWQDRGTKYCEAERIEWGTRPEPWWTDREPFEEARPGVGTFSVEVGGTSAVGAWDEPLAELMTRLDDGVIPVADAIRALQLDPEAKARLASEIASTPHDVGERLARELLAYEPPTSGKSA